MADDGNKICLDATAGSEKIEIKDQFDNKVVLNAAKKRIELKATDIPSKIELGTTTKSGYGVYIETDGKYKVKAKDQYIKEIDSDSITTVNANYETSVRGDYKTLVRGEYTVDVQHNYKSRVKGRKSDMTEGAKLVTVLGGKADVIVGGKVESCIGAKIDSCVGGKLVVEAGGKMKIGKMNEYDWNFEKVETCENQFKILASKVSYLASEIKMQADQLLKMNAPVINMCGGIFKVKE